jgi:hypothetical protein
MRSTKIEVEWSILPRRNRNRPRRTNRAAKIKRLAVDDDMVVEHFYKFAPAALRIAAIRLRIGHRAHEFLPVARMPIGRHVVVVKAARALVKTSSANRRERPLPYRALVRDRAVGMSGKRHRVWEGRQRTDRFAAIVAHGVLAVARSLRMLVLAIEERLRTTQLRGMRLEVVLDWRL